MKKFKIAVFVTCILMLFLSFFSEGKSACRVDILSDNPNSISIEGNKEIKIEKNETQNSVIIPTSVFYKTNTIKISSKNKEKITLLFRSDKNMQNMQEDNMSGINCYLPVTYKQIKVNNEVIRNKISKAKYTNPKEYEFVLNGKDNLDLEFKVKTAMYKENSSSYILFGALMLFFVFFINTEIFKKDYIGIIKSRWAAIDPIYKKSFFTIFIITNMVYLLHTVTFMWGNHDVVAISDKATFGGYIYMGRYCANLLKCLFLSGHYLPIITNLLAFAALSLSGVMLLRYWKITKDTGIYVICGLLITLQPFVLEWLFYVDALPEFFFILVAIILAFMLMDRGFDEFKNNKKNSILKMVFSIVLLNMSLAVYPSCINTIMVVLFGGYFIKSIKWSENNESIKNEIKRFLYYILNIGTACVIYKIVILCLENAGKLLSIYTIKSITLSELPQRIVECIKASFIQLYNYKFSFMPHITDCFMILLAILVFYLLFLHKNEATKKSEKLFQLILLVLALISTKIAVMLCAEPLFYAVRIDFFGLVIFRVLVAAVILSLVDKAEIKNFALALLIFILGNCAVNDFDALRVWKLGKQSEMMRWNRYLSRIESNENFNVTKEYTLIQFGAPKPTRSRFYADEQKWNTTHGLVSHTYDPQWNPFALISYFYDYPFAHRRYNSRYIKEKSDEMDILIDAYKNNRLNKLKAWPSKDAILIYDDIILVVFDEEELNRVKKELAKGTK